MTAVLTLGEDDLVAWSRLGRWSTLAVLVGGGLCVTGGLGLLGAGAAVLLGALLVAAGLVGAVTSVRFGRAVEVSPPGELSIHRPLLPPRRYTDVVRVVLDERAWGIAAPVPGDPDSPVATLAVELADGNALPLGELEWPTRRAQARSWAQALGVELEVRGSASTASCG